VNGNYNYDYYHDMINFYYLLKYKWLISCYQLFILLLAGCLKASTIYIKLAFTFLFLTDLTERSVDRRLFEAGFLFPYNQDKDGNTLGNDLQ